MNNITPAHKPVDYSRNDQQAIAESWKPNNN